MGDVTKEVLDMLGESTKAEESKEEPTKETVETKGEGERET